MGILKFNGVIESENSPGFMEKYTASWEFNGDLYLYGIYGVSNYLYYNGGGLEGFSPSMWRYHSILKKWQLIDSFIGRDNFQL